MKFLSLFAVALVAAAPATAALRLADGTVVRRIGYADLDLASAAGKVALRHRVGHAVAVVCRTNDTPTLLDRAAAAKCTRTALAAADRQMTVDSASTASGRAGGE